MSDEMYLFHAVIHALPEGTGRGDRLVLECGSFETLCVTPEMLSTPLPVSFEEASRRLGQLPRMFVEPDGSFVWTSPASAETLWQVDGVLSDRNDRLIFVDVKGCCPASAFDQLLGACGWPDVRLAFQIVRQAVFLDEAEFRLWAARNVDTG